jgi:hypothetical protein
MNSSWLVEIASMWAYHASARVEENCPFPREAVHEYWLQNRLRFDSWNTMLSSHERAIHSESIAKRVRGWQKLRRVIEEVLLSEPLTRVTAAIATRLESRQIDHDSRAILHNVFSTHQEVRNRCLRSIAQGIQRGIGEADELNSLRHYLEHWTDMLLGYFSNKDHAIPYAHCMDRVDEFSSDYGERKLGDQSQIIWTLLIASCREWLNKHVNHEPVSPRSNHQISQCSLGMIHPDLFDSMGLMRSHLVQRIEKGLEQAGETIRKVTEGTCDTMSSILTQPTERASSRIHF